MKRGFEQRALIQRTRPRGCRLWLGLNLVAALVTTTGWGQNSATADSISHPIKPGEQQSTALHEAENHNPSPTAEHHGSDGPELRAPPVLATDITPATAPGSGPKSPKATDLALDLSGAGPSANALHVPRYRVEAIELQGNQRTDASLILQRVSIKKGAVLDENLVSLSRARLLATGFFVDVNMTLKKGQRRGWVIVLITVNERPPIPAVDGIFLGFSETTPFFAGLSLVEPNLLGRGITLGGGFLFAPEQQSLRLRGASGRLFAGPLDVHGDLLFLRGREPIAFGSDPRAGGHLDYMRGGGQLGLSLALGALQGVAVDYHGEAIRADLKLRPGVRHEPLIQVGNSYLSTLQLSYYLDSRDRGFIPSHGAQLFVGAELSSAMLFSSYEFSRYHLSYEQYIPTWAMHSFSLRLDLGAVQPGQAQGNVSGAPFFAAYYIGDYSFFRRNRNSLPRQMGLNLSAFSTYDDLLASLTLSYAYPIHLHGSMFYRIYIYASVNVSEGTTLRELQGVDVADDRFPVTFDAGLKFDTAAGAFVLSTSYLLDLVL